MAVKSLRLILPGTVGTETPEATRRYLSDRTTCAGHATWPDYLDMVLRNEEAPYRRPGALQARMKGRRWAAESLHQAGLERGQARKTQAKTPRT